LYSVRDVRRYFCSWIVVNRWTSFDQETVDVGSINSFKGGLDKIRKTRMGFFMDLAWTTKPRPHGDGTPVRPHTVSYKVIYITSSCTGHVNHIMHISMYLVQLPCSRQSSKRFGAE